MLALSILRARPAPEESLTENAVEWAEQMEQLMGDVSDLGKTAELTVVGPPGPTYTVRPQKR